MRKLKLTWLLLILLVLSSACSPGSRSLGLRPVTPILDVQVQENGGICLDKEDTLRLLRYLQELERGYDGWN